MDNKQHKTMTLGRRETNELSLTIIPAYDLEVVSRLKCREKEPEKAE